MEIVLVLQETGLILTTVTVSTPLLFKKKHKYLSLLKKCLEAHTSIIYQTLKKSCFKNVSIVCMKTAYVLVL